MFWHHRLLQENAEAYFIKLSKDDLKFLEDAFGKDKVRCAQPSAWTH